MATNPPKARQFAVEGMMCEGCVGAVTSVLQALSGVEQVDVSLAEKRATVVADEAQVPSSAIEAAIAEAGYEARPINPAE